MEDTANNIFSNILNAILTAMIIVVAFFAVVFTSFFFVYEQREVRGVSMQPLLNPNVTLNAHSNEDCEDFAFVNKYGPVSRNNIVVADVSWFSDGSIIKRVVGVPGDLINVEDEDDFYALYVNGELFYTRPKTDGNRIGTYNNLISFCNTPSDNVYIDEESNKKYIKVNDGEYFLLGDNWSNSTDSAVHGCTKQDEIVGRVDFIIHKDGSYVLQYIKALVEITFTTKPCIFC